MKKKHILIIGGIVVAVVAYLMIAGKQAVANAEGTLSFSSSDEQATYEEIKSLIPTSDQPWVIELAMARGGDKAMALAEILFEVAPNPKGSHSYNYGGGGLTKVLWSESVMSKIYELYSAYKLRKSGW